MNSFIISIDSTFEMTDNFLNRFLEDHYVQNNEVIIIVDGNHNSKIYELLSYAKGKYKNLSVIYSEKVGYGKANNTAAKHAQGDILFFINSDVLKRCRTQLNTAELIACNPCSFTLKAAWYNVLVPSLAHISKIIFLMGTRLPVRL